MKRVEFTEVPSFKKVERDVGAGGDLYVATVNTPGVRPKDLHVQLTGREAKVHTFLPEEKTFTFNLPRNVVPETVEAEYVFGQLVVTVTPRALPVFNVEVKVATE